MTIAAAAIMALTAVLGLGGLAAAWFNKAHKRRRRMALLNKAQGLGR